MLDGALTIGGRGTENIQWESAHTASTRRTNRGISRYVARYLGFGVARRAAKRQLSTLNSQLSVPLPQPTRELHPALRVLPRAPSLSVHRPLGLALIFLLALAFNSQLSTAFAANVHFKRIYPIGGAPNTNVFRIQSCSSNILADGTPMQVLGNPVRVQPDTNGDVTVTNLQINWYQNLDDQYIFQVYDSSSTLYDVTNLLQSGYNLFIVRNYGSNNAAVTWTTVTNALGYTPANQTNLLYTSNILATANQAFGANETNLVIAVSNSLAALNATFGANDTNNVTAVSNILAAATTAARTNTLYTSNQLAASVAATYYPLTNPSNYITAAITNSLASTNYVQTSVSASNYITKTQVIATNALALAAATNTAATQGNASTNFTLLIGANGTNNTTAVSNILATATAAARTNTLYTSNVLAALNATFGANDTNNVTAVSNILATATQTFGANGTNNVTAVSNILAAATAAARTNTLYTSNILAALNATFGANDTNNVTAVSNILAAAIAAARTNTLYTSNILAAATASNNATLSAAIGLSVTNTQRTVTLGGLSLLDLGVNYWSGTLPGIFGSGAWLGFDTNATTLRIGYLAAGSSIALNAQSGRITALTFSGDGSALTGLTNLPVAAITNLPPTLTALSNQIAWVQSQVGCDTNFLLVTVSGVGSIVGTNVWTGSAWTNLNGLSWWSNNAWYASGIAAYGGAYPTTGTTNINGFNPQPVARFFPKTNVAGSNITITRSYGVDTIAATSSGGGSATNVSTTNLVGYVSGVLTQGLTNLIFSAAGTNAILSIIPAASGVTNATLQQYTTNTVINVNAYVTNNVADQIGLAAAKSLAATNAIGLASGLSAFAPTNRFLLSGPLGNNDGALLANTPGTQLTSSNNTVTLGISRLGNGETNYDLALNTNLSLTIGAQILNTNTSADFTNRVRNIAAGSATNAIANTNGTGTATTLVNAQTISVTNQIVYGDTYLNNSSLHIYVPTNGTGPALIPYMTATNLPSGFASASSLATNALFGFGAVSSAWYSALVAVGTNWIQYQFPSTVIVNMCSGVVGTVAAYVGSDKGYLNLQSSFDGITWSNILTTGIWTNNYTLNNVQILASGSYFRWNIYNATTNIAAVASILQLYNTNFVSTSTIDSLTNLLVLTVTNGLAIGTNTANGYMAFINGFLFATNAYFPTATIGDFSSSSLSGADVSSSGNMDAQTYTANGAPITFLTNNITALIASGGTGQAAALNGIYYPNGGNWTNVGAGAGIARSGSTWLMSTSTAAILYKNNGSVIGYYRTNGVVGTNGGMTVAVYSQTTGTFPITQISTNGGNVNQVPTVSASGQVVWTNASGGSTAGAVTTNMVNNGNVVYVMTNGTASGVRGQFNAPFALPSQAVAVMQSNDTMVVYSGAYVEGTNKVVLPKNTSMIGLGTARIYFSSTNTGAPISVYLTPSDNCVVNNLFIYSTSTNKYNAPIGFATGAASATNVLIQNIVAPTCDSDGYYNNTASYTSGQILNCQFLGCFDLITWDSTANANSDWIVKDCIADASFNNTWNPASRRAFNIYAGKIKIFNCLARSTKTGTGNVGVSQLSASANVTLENVYFDVSGSGYFDIYQSGGSLARAGTYTVSGAPLVERAYNLQYPGNFQTFPPLAGLLNIPTDTNFLYGTWSFVYNGDQDGSDTTKGGMVTLTNAQNTQAASPVSIDFIPDNYSTNGGGLRVNAGKLFAGNGFLSYATNAAVSLGAAGVTNNMGCNAGAYVTATATSWIIKNRANATIYTSPTLTATVYVHLQPGWSVSAASGLAGTLLPE
jgi:hypothetical protein